MVCHRVCFGLPGLVSTPDQVYTNEGGCVARICLAALQCVRFTPLRFAGLRVRRILTGGVGNEPLSFRGTSPDSILASRYMPSAPFCVTLLASQTNYRIAVCVLQHLD